MAMGHGPTLDRDKVEDFAQQVAGMLTGGATAAMMVVGDRLGLYAALARTGPLTAAGLASATGTSERYVREWLAQQAAVGFVSYDAAAGAFALPPEHAAVLATDDSPASMIGGSLLIAGLHRRADALVEAFRTGEGIAWDDQDQAIFESTERFFGAAYRTRLLSEWIPALRGMRERLEAGARVADIGCGRGGVLILMARAYPQSRFTGFDAHEASIHTARERAAAAGLSDRLRFEVADSHGYPADGYDLITFFATLHDLGDPVGAAAHARTALTGDGVLMLVEPYALDDLADNVARPRAGLSYAASAFLCVPSSLSQPVGLALGAQPGEARLRDVLTEAGYRTVRRAAETPLNLVLEARP